MDLISVDPMFNLYNQEWPILTWPDPLPPAKFVFDEDGGAAGRRWTRWSAPASSSPAATVRRSVLSPGAHLHSYAEVEDSRRSCRASTSAAARSCAARSSTRTCGSRRGAQIGVDPEADRERFTVSGGGVVVIPKGATVEA